MSGAKCGILEFPSCACYIAGMGADAAKLLDEALSLPAEARAALAASLIDSLDQTIDPDAEAAWSKEITKRLKELDEGLVQTIPWSEVRAALLER
jgi:putative addiction module component (TIGR02574 family)